jgi:hypothetical protein
MFFFFYCNYQAHRDFLITLYYCVRFEVLIVVTMKINVLWDLMVSSLVGRGACILEEHCVFMFRVNNLKCLA